ncbi:hypothetical protein PRIPAC_81653 [Pristionchus pacificus]|uniref:Uncharacterized protein n=1 Tax=Pristionchus pacificus TaxID=54126 RepID=A0A2A6CMR0_PRIPA|nr:hypothetical protein PRIPAC_81653 [Pristionchus pacificus]|eukprot:PDM79388.1 hypothetical protein PRIPAC_31967 [Pristionchus pacificus]
MSYATVSYTLWIIAVVIVMIMLFACRPDNESRRCVPDNTHRVVKSPLSVLEEEDEPKIDSDLPTSAIKSSEQMQLEITDLGSTSLYIAHLISAGMRAFVARNNLRSFSQVDSSIAYFRAR